MKELVHNIRTFEKSLGDKIVFKHESVNSASKKLERSLATNRLLHIGHVLSVDDVHMISPGDGMRWEELDKIIGKKVQRNYGKNELIRDVDFK